MLQKRLDGLPKDEIEERLTFYCEMIDVRMEDGVNEEDAVSEVGDIDVWRTVTRVRSLFRNPRATKDAR